MIKNYRQIIKRSSTGLVAAAFASLQLLFSFAYANAASAQSSTAEVHQNAVAQVQADTLPPNANEQAHAHAADALAAAQVTLPPQAAAAIAAQVALPDVTLCHATGSASNPYSVVTVNAAGAFNGHLGAGHQGGDDIVPPFVFGGQIYSQNWDAAGQAIFNNGCMPPVVAPVDVCPNIAGVQVTVPVGMIVNNVGLCVAVVVDTASVTLCHATGSASNPYSVITVNAAGAFNGHLGQSHQDGDDIIPPFTYNGQVYSQNWDAAGQAIFNNGCVVPVVAPVDVCPNIAGVQVTVPVGMIVNNAGNCVVPVVPADNVTLCHATGSATNPYVLITISAAGAFNGHLGQSHQDGDDIIPPFTYNGQTYSQNWDAAGQAIFNNGCVIPGSNPVDVCPNIPGTQVTVPIGLVINGAGNCVAIVTPGGGTGVPPIITDTPTPGRGGGVVQAAVTPAPKAPAHVEQLADTGANVLVTMAAALALLGIAAGTAFTKPRRQFQ